MGKEFGNLQKLSGVITYTLSPHEVKPFTGMMNPGIKNVLRRFSDNIVCIGLPMLLTYGLYKYATTEHERLTRKNPDDFKDDV